MINVWHLPRLVTQITVDTHDTAKMGMVCHRSGILATVPIFIKPVGHLPWVYPYLCYTLSMDPCKGQTCYHGYTGIQEVADRPIMDVGSGSTCGPADFTDRRQAIGRQQSNQNIIVCLTDSESFFKLEWRFIQQKLTKNIINNCIRVSTEWCCSCIIWYIECWHYSSVVRNVLASSLRRIISSVTGR
jgi:hypothetical protein